jgi:hypothetical protein
MMALARPIDASIPSSFINHPRSPLKRTSRRSTGARKADCASGADSPRGIDRGQFVGARVPPGDRVTGGDWLLPTNRLGLGRIRRLGPSPAGHAAFRYASLRATRGVHSRNRMRKVQGGDFITVRLRTHGTRASFGIRRLEDRSREPQRSVRDPPKSTVRRPFCVTVLF